MTRKQGHNQTTRNTDVLRRLLACLAGCALMAILWFLPFSGEFLSKITRYTQDYFVRNDTSLSPRNDIVFLGIDADSMQLDSLPPELIENEPTLGKMSDQWPWKREVHAAAIDRLADAGAKLIVIDLIFNLPSTPESDQALADAITRHRDKIVLASAFIPGEEGAQMRVVEPLDAFLGPLDNETASGFVNFWPHPEDNIVRYSHFKQTLSGANNTGDVHPDEPVFTSLAAAAANKLGVDPPDEPGRFQLARIQNKNLDHTYSPLSYHTIFVPDDWQNRYQNGAFFKDKIVFIGPASPIFQDNHDTSAGRIYGAQLHMHVLTALLEDAWFKTWVLDRKYLSILLLIGCAISCLICFRLIRPWFLGVAILTGTLIWFLIEISSANYSKNLIGGMASLTTYGIGIIAAILWQAITERARRQQLHRHLRRSMSPDVADAVARAPEGYYKAAEGNRRTVTVLFTDIRSFTTRSETQDPGELINQLNTYLEHMVNVIFEHGGTVDKFIGDAIMATWGTLGDTPPEQQARQATSAAQKMLESLRELNISWLANGHQPFRIGIGIHQGDAIVGEVGSDQRNDFTVIGDTVNLASRIEGLTKQQEVELLITAAVHKKLEHPWHSLGKHRVRGRDAEVEVFTPRP